MNSIYPALQKLKVGDHACFLYETEEEHRIVLTDFLHRGLAQNQKILYVADAQTSDQVLDYLRSDKDVDAEQAVDKGQLTFLSPQQFYLQDGVFDPDATIQLLRQKTQSALEEGYAALWITCEMSWVLSEPPGAERLSEFETKVNKFFVGNSAIGLFQYDRQRFSPEPLKDALRTHPIAVIGANTYRNFYYKPPAELLGETPAQAELDQWLDHLTEDEDARREQSLVMDNTHDITDRREAEEALYQSEEKYRRMFECSPESVVLLDTEGNVLDINGRLGEWLGYKADELTGRKLWDFPTLKHDTKEEFKSRFEERMAGVKVPPYEVELLSKNNETYTGLVHGTVLTDAQGNVNGDILLITDITQRKQTEQELRAAYDKLDKLVELNADGIMVINQEGFILFANPAAEALIGRNTNELLGQHFGHPLTPGGITEIELFSEGNRTSVVELQTTETEWDGDSAFLMSLRDITEHKQTEREIRHLNSLLGAIRNINQIIVQETDPRSLMEQACSTLLETRSYEGCAVALLDNTAETLTPFAQAGKQIFSKNWSVSKEGEGEAPNCVKEAIRSREMCLKNSSADCGDCPYEESAEDYAAATVPMMSGEKVIGILHVHISKQVKIDDKEQNLLHEVAQDLAFARDKLLADQDLRDRDAKLEAIIASAPYVMVLVDSDRRVRQINAAGTEFAGRSTEELLGLHAGEALRCIHALDDPRGCGFGHACEECPVRNTVLETLSSRKGYEDVEVDMTFERSDGQEDRTFLFHTKPLEVNEQQMCLVVFDDITEYKEVERRQKELQEFTQSTIDSLTAHIAVLDETANIITVNAAWRHFADDNGLQWPEYGIGINYLDIVEKSPDGQEAEGAADVSAEIRKLLSEQTDTFEREYPCHSPDEERWFRLRGTRFKSSHGTRVVLAHLNITERKKAELELQKALDDLQKSQQKIVEQERQQALTTMASGIAHDFNNALSPIQGFADMLIEDEEVRNDPEKFVRYVEHIRRSAKTAAETVRRMRKFYRPREETSFVPVDLNKVIEEAVSVTEPRWKQESQASGRHIEIRTEPNATSNISGNEAELHEMLTNLIFNAVDAMPEGGKITVKSYTEDGNAILEFSDTGVGMSEETKSRCLDPFYTTKGAEGSGLGLASLQGTVDRHNGKVDIQSTEGEGTIFRIALPLSDGRTDTIEQKGDEHTQSLHILVVEDEPGQRELLTAFLEADGHTVDLAHDGIEGLRKFSAGWYDLVLTDRAMPNMGGDQMAKEVKEKAPDKSVVMLTGFGDMMDAAGENPSNVDAVISKPFTRQKLQDVLSELV